MQHFVETVHEADMHRAADENPWPVNAVPPLGHSGASAFPHRGSDPWGWKYNVTLKEFQVWNASIFVKGAEEASATSLTLTLVDGDVKYIYGLYNDSGFSLNSSDWPTAGDTTEAEIEAGYFRVKAFNVSLTGTKFKMERDWIHGRADFTLTPPDPTDPTDLPELTELTELLEGYTETTLPFVLNNKIVNLTILVKLPIPSAIHEWAATDERKILQVASDGLLGIDKGYLVS